jgi:protein ImuB
MFAGLYSQQIPAEVSLAEFAYAFSPFVEKTAADTVVIDVEGCELLFGSAYELARDIVKSAAQKRISGGLESKVNVALAANPDAAIHAAKFCKGLTFTAAGEELTCLGILPLKALQYSLVGVEESRASEILETLKLWGVHTFKEFAELPAAGVSERLGQDGLKLQELARGTTSRHLRLKQAAPVFKNSIELEYPIAQLEPLSFIFARLLNQICASLNAYALATNAIRVELKLERGASHELKLNLPYPMRDHKVFLKLLLLDTETHPPPSGVTAVTIDCEPVKPRLLQSGLFIPLAPEPEKLELTLARLAKLVGLENIGSPELIDTHRPDAFRVKRFVLKEAKRRRSKQQTADSRQQAGKNPKSEIRNPKSAMGFRVFRPPLRALVQAEEGRPTEISAWDKQRSVYGKVVGVAGPWRTTGDWWRTDTWARDEWDVAVETKSGSGGHTGPHQQVLYRIFRELGSGTWFVDGIYD